MVIYTGSFFDVGSNPKAISISRKDPKWFKGKRCPKLAPNDQIWDVWWRNKNEKQYIRLYKHQLKVLNIDSVLDEIGDGAILLCWESANKFCHRHIVREWIEAFRPDVRTLEMTAPQGTPEMNGARSDLELERLGDFLKIIQGYPTEHREYRNIIIHIGRILSRLPVETVNEFRQNAGVQIVSVLDACNEEKRRAARTPKGDDRRPIA